MYCVKCGNEIDDKADVCIHCGVYTARQKNIGKDSSSFFAAIFSFFFPVIGLVLYLLYENSRPLTARSFKRGMMWGFAVYGVVITLVLLFYIAIFVFALSNVFTQII